MSNLAQFENLKIPLDAIKAATNNFSDDNLIGKGGYGNVYKGELVRSNWPITVAIKRIDRKYGQGDPEFYKEITTLSYYKHENIVSFLGFCSESSERILVYEYAPKGSLDMHLHNVDLTWIRRLKICIGAARGLAYLHNPDGGQYRVLHRDIKSSNILLHENWNAKISDFGLARLGFVNPHFGYIYDDLVGTPGYCDPRYMETKILTVESDVYSFGVVLFEVLCGRLCVRNKNDKPLPEVVQECKADNKFSELIDCNIREEINPNSLEAFTKIAFRCLKKERKDRPSAADIVRELETSLNLQIKPLNQQLDQHSHKIEERERAIFEREKAMTQRENLVFKREQAIYEREQALFVREQALSKRE